MRAFRAKRGATVHESERESVEDDLDSCLLVLLTFPSNVVGPLCVVKV